MPGEVSRASKGPSNVSPYVPAHCYPDGAPKICTCGHHEGYHQDRNIGGKCLKCNCPGIPEDCVTPFEIIAQGSV